MIDNYLRVPGEGERDTRYKVKCCRFGTVHIVRYWEVWCDGKRLDTYATRDLADAYCSYMNARTR